MARSGFITLSAPRLFLCSKSRGKIRDMSSYIDGGYVEWNADFDGPKMICELSVRRPDLFRAIADFVMIEIDITPYQRSMQTITYGPFRLGFADEMHFPRGTEAMIKGEDISILLDKAVIMSKTTMRKGTNYGTYIEHSLKQVIGPSRIDVRATAKNAGLSRTWWRGTTERQRSSELCEAIGYYHPFMNMSGRLQTLPYRDFAKAEPSAVWDGWVIDGNAGISRQPPPADDVFNVVIVRRDRGDTFPLVSIRENHDARSPVSIENLDGQREIKVISNNTAETIEDIQAASRNILQEGAMRYEGLSFRVPPDRSVFQIYQSVDLNIEALNTTFIGRYHLRRWRFNLDPDDALVDVDVYRVIDLDI